MPKNNPYGNSGDEWRQRWQTPPEVLDLTRRIIGPLDWDVCANAHNSACGEDYFGPGSQFQEDGLDGGWHLDEGVVIWCNPPFNDLERWVEQCAIMARDIHITSVMLCNVSTETKWWRDWVNKAQEVHYLYPRVQFIPPPDSPMAGARHKPGNSNGQALVVWRPNWNSYRQISPLTTSVGWK